jgi:hypothetical protein
MDNDKPLAKGEARSPAERERDSNPLGTHPVGTAVGGVTGAATAGAVVGSAAGPVGTAIGAAVGAVAGGVTGKLIADVIDPQMEEEFWRNNFGDRNYVQGEYDFDQDWAPAYRYGVQTYMDKPEQHFADMEPELSSAWREARGESRLGWDQARFASMDAWQRAKDLAERSTPGDSDRDGK